eukprot:TRINITY_DN2603_c0_g1_i1.p1 TRINITY_DN2603_c0_g1~~TRINITY_DN2603_c0_g1_i1.p1  ORF type:complete len:615 (-),score=173.71 TRINITY_DN2603_c0_g1_i1:165-2009(-)
MSKQPIKMDEESSKDVSQLKEMFGDLTQSVLYNAYLISQGNLDDAVNMLVDLGNQQDIIQDIRNTPATEISRLVNQLQSSRRRKIEEMKRNAEMLIRDLELKIPEEVLERIDFDDEVARRLVEFKAKEAALAEEDIAPHGDDTPHTSKVLASVSVPAPVPVTIPAPSPAPVPEVPAPTPVVTPAETKEKTESPAPVIPANPTTKISEAYADDVKQLIEAKVVKQMVDRAELCTMTYLHSPETISVQWELQKDYKPDPDHWIGFYRLGFPDNKYRSYQTTGGQVKGEMQFRTPKTPGIYIFRYFLDKGYDNMLTTSEAVHIGPKTDIKAILVQDKQNSRLEKIEFELRLERGEISSGDWIGLYLATEKNNRNYISFVNAVPQKAESSQQYVMDAPRRPGNYVVRFFPKPAKFQHLKQSNNIRISNRDTMNVEEIKDDLSGRTTQLKVKWDIFSVDHSSSDYIALYSQSSPNNHYVTYQYITSNRGEMTFEAPNKINTYEFRYHSLSKDWGKNKDVCRSNPFEIQNTDWVNVEVTKNLITVKFDIHSEAATKWDWVGIFKEGEANNASFLKYKYVTAPGIIFFETDDLPSGVYEARYFSSTIGKYVSFRKSNTFEL